MVGKLSKRLIPTYKWLKIARFLWSLFYLQVYLWITASSLTQFMATYGNHKNVTCFIPLLPSTESLREAHIAQKTERDSENNLSSMMDLQNGEKIRK